MARDQYDIAVGPPENDAEIDRFVDIVWDALFFPQGDRADFIDREGRENVTVARIGGRICGGSIIQPLGLSFGGKCVAMDAVRVVGVQAEDRSKGVGRALMEYLVRQTHARGVPISGLYPATLPVYRRAGFEQAGTRMTYRYPLGIIGRQPREATVRALTSDDRPAIEALYAKRLLASPGNLERNEWAWQRILDPAPWYPRPHAFIAEEGGTATGYMVFGHKRGSNIVDNTLAISDITFETEAAGRSLLGLLTDHRSMATTFEYCGAPADRVSMLLPENRAEALSRFDWMLRLVDVVKAMESRGFASGACGELHLEVEDDILSDNTGRFVLSVEAGRASVRKGGDGKLRAHVRGLAPLYAGFMSAEGLRTVGKLECDDESARIATGLFAGASPWMSDMF